MSNIILITHQKGGVGKSTLTFNLAQNIAKDSKVAVLDCRLFWVVPLRSYMKK